MHKLAQRKSNLRSTKQLAGAGLLAIGLLANCGDDSSSSPDARPAVADAEVNTPDADVNAPDADVNAPDAGLADAGLDGGGVPDAEVADAALPDAAVPTGNGNAIWEGDFTTNGTEEFAFFDGTNISTLTIPGVTEIDFVTSAAISPDGTQIAIGMRHDGGTPVLLVANIDGSGVSTVIVDDAVATVDFFTISWSPDGSQLAFVRDIEANNQKRVYVAAADGSTGTPLLVSQNPDNASQDAQNVDWIDNTHVVYRGDLVLDGADNFFSSDITLNPAVPVPLIPDNVVLNGAEGRDNALTAGGMVYFRSTHEGSNRLYRVNPDGTGLEIVPAYGALTNGDGDAEVGAFALSPDGTSIAFSADSPTADLYQVFVAPLNGDATLQSNLTTDPPALGISGPIGRTAISWSADGSMLAVIADWVIAAGDVDNDRSAFVIPAVGAAGGVRVWTVSQQDSNQDVDTLLFSSDSASLFAKADLNTNNNTEVLRTTDFVTPDQDTSATLLQGVPTSGDVKALVTLP